MALLVAAHALRWWWHPHSGSAVDNPGDRRPAGRPGVGRDYRYLRHPNYVAVVVEGIALPLVHTAWLTALIFTLINAILLVVRIRVEEAGVGPAGPRDAVSPS